MLIVTGRILTSPAAIDELLHDLRSGIARSLQEDGCQVYTFAVEDAAAGSLLTLQIWRNEAALAAHLCTSDIATLVGKWAGRFDVQTRLYDANNERAVGVWNDPTLQQRINESRIRHGVPAQ